METPSGFEIRIKYQKESTVRSGAIQLRSVPSLRSATLPATRPTNYERCVSARRHRVRRRAVSSPCLPARRSRRRSREKNRHRIGAISRYQLRDDDRESRALPFQRMNRREKEATCRENVSGQIRRSGRFAREKPGLSISRVPDKIKLLNIKPRSPWLGHPSKGHSRASGVRLYQIIEGIALSSSSSLFNSLHQTRQAEGNRSRFIRRARKRDGQPRYRRRREWLNVLMVNKRRLHSGRDITCALSGTCAK